MKKIFSLLFICIIVGMMFFSQPSHGFNSYYGNYEIAKIIHYAHPPPQLLLAHIEPINFIFTSVDGVNHLSPARTNDIQSCPNNVVVFSQLIDDDSLCNNTTTLLHPICSHKLFLLRAYNSFNFVSNNHIRVHNILLIRNIRRIPSQPTDNVRTVIETGLYNYPVRIAAAPSVSKSMYNLNSGYTLL